MLDLIKQFGSVRVGTPGKRAFTGINSSTTKRTRKQFDIEWDLSQKINDASLRRM